MGIEREYKSKVGWWYHLTLFVMLAGSVLAILSANAVSIVAMLLGTLFVIHIFLHTDYRITADEHLVARCGILPEKRIAIADIEALEASVMPVSSYALSLDRLIVWSGGKPWLLISPVNRDDFIRQLRKINPNIQLK